MDLWNMDLEQSFHQHSQFPPSTSDGDAGLKPPAGSVESEHYPTVDLWNMDLEDTFDQQSEFPLSITDGVDEPEPPNGSVGFKRKHGVAGENIKRGQQKERRYTELLLQSMLAQIRDGSMTKYHAEKYYGVPRGTLQYRLSSAFRNKGRTGPDSVLTTNEEEVIVRWLQTMERRGFPITRYGLRYKVSAYLRANPRPNPCRDNVPGK